MTVIIVGEWLGARPVRRGCCCRMVSRARTLAGGACCCELTKRRFGGLDRNRQRSRAIFDRMSLRSWIHCDCL